MGFRAYSSKGVDKNRAKCNMGFNSDTFIFFEKRRDKRFPERTLDDSIPPPRRKLHGGGHWGQVDGHTGRSARRVGGEPKGGEGAARERGRNPSWTNGTWENTRTGCRPTDPLVI